MGPAVAIISVLLCVQQGDIPLLIFTDKKLRLREVKTLAWHGLGSQTHTLRTQPGQELSEALFPTHETLVHKQP